MITTTDKNIKVFCRIRPFTTEERFKSHSSFEVSGKSIFILKDNATRLQFSYSKIFTEETTQELMFNEVGKFMIDEIFKGYNCTIFAYGQSGSGKTYTLTGYSHIVDNRELLLKNVELWKHPKDMGLVPRIVKEIFNQVLNSKESQFTIRLSYVEIYMEKIRDLLNPVNTNLEVHESQESGIWIEDVKEVYTTNFEDAIKAIRRAETNRTVASTNLNVHSSRSHSVLTVYLTKETAGEGKIHSRIVFVDLAGSERITKSGAEGLTLKQAQYTNKSLLTLGLVIRALLNENDYVPYRDSKLTRILRESIGGNSKTCLITTISPSSLHTEETLSTLRFGSDAQQIQNTPEINLEISNKEYKRLLEEAQERIRVQEETIKLLRKNKPSEEVETLKQENILLKDENERYKERVLLLEAEIETTKLEGEQGEQSEQSEKTDNELQKRVDNLIKENLELRESLMEKVRENIPELSDEEDEEDVDQEKTTLTKKIESKETHIKILEESLKKAKLEANNYQRKYLENQKTIRLTVPI